MITVIIPLYNKESSIKHALESVLKQTFQDFEIVIVNDGSIDKSLEEAQKFRDSRIRIFSQQNAGVSAARNKGIDEAHGEYVAFLDADDEWMPDFLQTIDKLISKYPQCDVFALNYERMRDGEILPTTLNKMNIKGENGVFSNYFQVAASSLPPICSISIAIRRNAILSIGGFPVGVKAGEDLLTWARLAVKYKIAYSRKVCARYILPDSENSKTPRRRLIYPDVVGKNLEVLAKENPDIIGLKDYVSLWHKMRSHIALGWGEHNHAIKEALKGLRYKPTNIKLYLMIILALLPSKMVSAAVSRR